jgi:predicted RNase H-like nuclease (RuvC/YqgF family)
MDLNTLISVVSAIIAGGSLYVAFRKSKPEIKVLNSQEQLNLATALKQAAEALSESLTDRGVLEQRIDQLELHREQRAKEIEEQKREIESLRTEIVAMQIDEQEKRLRMVAKLDAWEQWFIDVEKLLKELGKDVPPRPAALTDSDPKIKRAR